MSKRRIKHGLLTNEKISSMVSTLTHFFKQNDSAKTYRLAIALLNIAKDALVSGGKVAVLDHKGKVVKEIVFPNE